MSLLLEIQKQSKEKITSPFKNLTFKTELGASLDLILGGFPANFDSSGESVPPHEIQLTRALVLGGAVQAAEILKEKRFLGAKGRHMLLPEVQEFVSKEWIKLQGPESFSSAFVENFSDRDWISQNSGGKLYPCRSIFSKELAQGKIESEERLDSLSFQPNA